MPFGVCDLQNVKSRFYLHLDDIFIIWQIYFFLMRETLCCFSGVYQDDIIEPFNYKLIYGFLNTDEKYILNK